MEGFMKIKPNIKRITFEKRGKMFIYLFDGRTIIVPVSAFPSIKKLKEADRKHYTIIDDALFMFDKSNEVFHLEQVLGKENNYAYSFA
jgi:hypothetical protein